MIITSMYKTHKTLFKYHAKTILKKFYSIPLEEEDLISECLHQLMKKAKKYKPTEEFSLEKYLYSSIKYVMYTYCRSYIRKNNCILNNYVDFSLVENIESKTYYSLELNYDFLTKFQSEIINELYSNDFNIRKVAIKYKTTTNMIKEEIEDIKNNFQKQIDNSIDW